MNHIEAFSCTPYFLQPAEHLYRAVLGRPIAY